MKRKINKTLTEILVKLNLVTISIINRIGTMLFFRKKKSISCWKWNGFKWSILFCQANYSSPTELSTVRMKFPQSLIFAVNKKSTNLSQAIFLMRMKEPIIAFHSCLVVWNSFLSWRCLLLEICRILIPIDERAMWLTRQLLYRFSRCNFYMTILIRLRCE